MKKTNLLFGALMFMSNMTYIQAETDGDKILPAPAALQDNYEYYEVMSDEFNNDVSDIWLMDYMPWWSDTAKREKSGTRTRYRYIDASTTEDDANKSLQIYVNGENRMEEENFQPYYLEMLSGPTSAEAKDRYLATTKQKNSWNSKFAGFMAGSKDYLNTFRGSQSQIQSHIPYDDSGATTYGYFETRCKFLSMKSGQGLAPAFWFIGMQDEIYDRGEVDGFEFLDNYTLDFTIHPKGDPRIKKVTKQIKFTEDMSKDYHTYGVLWDSKGFSLYVDGVEKARHNQKIDYRMIPMFSINHHENGWIGSVDNKGLPEERTMDIDYYRVFKEKGVDPEPNKVVLPEMKEGNNIASAAYISLFGLTGTEADATPLQWLNDLDRSKTVLSSLNNGKMKTSRLPEYMYIDWKAPATYNTIVLHAQNAKSQAPTLVDFEVSEDGENWTTVQRDIKLDWKTDSQTAESQTITLSTLQKDNLHARILIKEANMGKGRFGLCEVEIGQNIKAMEPEYAELPEGVDLDMKNHMFDQWDMEDSLTSTSGITMTQTGNGISFGEGVTEGNKAIMFTGNSLSDKSYLKTSLKKADGSQIKSDQNFTLGMWIKPTNLSVNDDQLILFQQEGSKGGKPWLFIYQGKLGTYIGGENLYNSAQPLKANAWQYVSMTHTRVSDTAGEVTFYVDGELGSTVKTKLLPDSDCYPSAMIGAHKGLGKGFYNGGIDGITLLDDAISPAQMKAFYNANGVMADVTDKKYNISSVKPLEDITGTIGEIKEEDVVLPTSATAVFENTYVKDAPVIWNANDEANIDISKAGEYVVRGTLDLSGISNATNTASIGVTQKIIVKAVVDPSELEEVVQQINEVVEADYTAESFAEFLSACQSVQTKETLVLIGKYPNFSVSETLPLSATQDVIDGMSEELTKALLLLDEKPTTPVTPDTKELLDTLDRVTALTKADYTTQSWDHFMSVVEEARALLKKPSFTQAEVNAMTNKVKAGIANLEKATTTPEDPNKPSVPIDPTDPVLPETPVEPETPKDPIVEEDTTISSSDNTIIIKGDFGEDVQLSTKRIVLATLQTLLEDNEEAEQYQLEEAFDIELLKDNATYLVDGTIEIRLKLRDDLLDKNLSILYISEDGQIEKLESRIEDGYIIFTTSHLSVYAIASSEGSKAPATSDTTTTLPLMMTLGLSGAGLYLLTKKRKRSTK